MLLNLRSVDLNLLPVFEAAYEERSLSRAALRLAMTQPAVSHAMSRLRSVFRDELFIRQSRGVTPTPEADAIYAKLRGALGAVREAVVESRGFDPRTSARRFFVTIPHPLGPVIALAMRQHLAQAAPKVAVEYSTRSRPVELERGLRDGRVDAAIDWQSPHDKELRSVVLFEDRVVAMARAGHPALRLRTPGKVLKTVEFVTLRPRGDEQAQPEAIRDWARLNPRIALEVSELLEVLLVAGRSDLLGIMPASLAGIARANFGVRVVPASPKTQVLPTRLIWHARRERDPAHVYLRQQLTSVTAASVNA